MDRSQRHELKHDELVDGTLTILHRIEANPKPWLYGAIGVVGAVGIGLLVSWWIGQRAMKASDLLARGQAAMIAGVGGEQPPRPNDQFHPIYGSEAERAQAAVQRLAEASGAGGSVGSIARYLHGVAMLEAGDAAGAVKELEGAVMSLGADPSLASPARAALAAAYTAAQQHDKALEVYTNLAADTGNWYPRDLALAGKAKAQEALGRREDARGTWQQLIDLFPQSTLLSEARAATERLK